MMRKVSPLEETLAFQIRAAGLPEPLREYRIVPDRRYRWDFVWRDENLAVEVQGGIYTKGGHSTGPGIERDAEKLDLATLNGYRVLIVTRKTIESGQALKWIQLALEDDDEF
jgi:very-short-patch-repair endonuclease